MKILHPVQDHFDVIDWGLYTDLSLFVQLNDPEVNKPLFWKTKLRSCRIFAHSIRSWTLLTTAPLSGAILVSPVPSSTRSSLGETQSWGSVGGGGRGKLAGKGKLRQEARITHRASSTTRSSRFTVSDFFWHKFEGATALLPQTIRRRLFKRWIALSSG